MATGEDPFAFKDSDLDNKMDNDDDRQEANTTRPFEPYAASTPYNGREKIEMQTMQHEQSGLPDTSYEETPLLSGLIIDADIERRLAALRKDPRTGIINTTQMMDTSINPLGEEDRAEQIERVQRLIKGDYPNAKVDSLVIAFSKKRPMDIVVLGPKGGETKVVLNDGSGLQKSFLNLTYVKKALGTPAQKIITQTSVDIMKRQKELEKERVFEKSQQQTLRSKNEEIQNLDERLNKEQAIVDQLKENQGAEDEIERKKQLVKKSEKRLKNQAKRERRA